MTDTLVWRIATDTPYYESHDLAGKGAAASGGRWNRKGTSIVYSSTSRALACLETVVHSSGGIPLPLNRYLVEITIPVDLWDAAIDFDPARHVGWDAEPAGKVSLDWGTGWVRSKTSVIARVPSVIVPEEHNVLINPLHEDATRVRSIKLRKWTYDQRLG